MKKIFLIVICGLLNFYGCKSEKTTVQQNSPENGSLPPSPESAYISNEQGKSIVITAIKEIPFEQEFSFKQNEYQNYYSFTLSTDEAINFKTTHYHTEDIDIKIYDSHNKVVASSTSTDINESLSVLLKAGKYTLLIERLFLNSRPQAYQLSLEKIDADDLRGDYVTQNPSTNPTPAPDSDEAEESEEGENGEVSPVVSAIIDDCLYAHNGEDFLPFHRLKGHIEACKEENFNQTDFKIKTKEMNYCVDIIAEKFNAIKNNSCKSYVKTFLMNELNQFITTQIERIAITNTNNSVEYDSSNMDDIFNLLSSWEHKYKESIWKDHENLFTEESFLLSHLLWEQGAKHTSQNYVTNPENQYADNLTPYITIFKKSLQFNNLSPMIKIYLLTHILNPIYDRAQIFAAVKDLMCKLKDCSLRNKFLIRDNDVYKIFSLISHLPNESQYKSHMSQISSFIRSPVIVDFFNFMNTRYSDIKSLYEFMVNEMGVNSHLSLHDKILQMPLYNFRNPFYPLITLTKNSQSFFNQFNKNGLFRSENNNYVHFAFDKRVTSSILQMNSTIQSKLIEELLDFESTRDDILQALINEYNNDLTEQQLINEIDKEFLLSGDKLRQIEGFKNTIKQYEKDLGSSINSFQHLSNLDRFYDYFFQDYLPESQSKFNLKPSDARYFSGSKVNYISDIAVVKDSKFLKIRAYKGELLSVQSTGRWSPTCALRSSGIYKLEAIKDSQVGASGYNIVHEGSESNIISNTKSTTNTEYNESFKSSTFCSGINSENGFYFGSEAVPSFFSKVSVTASHQSCSGTRSGTSTQNQQSEAEINNTSNVSSVNFHSGLKLPNTPIPIAPVGSLALVQFPLDKTKISDVKDLHVIYETKSIVVTEDSDFYFVVNDCASSSSTTEGQLDIVVNKYKAKMEISKHVIDSLVKAFANIKNKEKIYIQSRSIGAQDISTLRSEIYNYIFKDTSYNIDEFEYLGDFFKYWVELNLSMMTAKVNIARLEDELRLHAFHIDKLYEEIDLFKKNQQLSQFRKFNLLQNFEQDMLVKPIHRSISFVEEYFLPALQFKDVKLYQALENPDNFNHNFDNRGLYEVEDFYESYTDLLGVHMGTSLDIVGNRLKNFFERLDHLIKMDEVVNNNNYEQDNIYSVIFPKPTDNTDLSYYSPLYTLDELSFYPVVDSIRSQNLWRAIQNGGKGKIKLTLDDLYNNPYALTGQSLSCKSSHPTIAAMALYFVVDRNKMPEFNLVMQNLNDITTKHPVDLNGKMEYVTNLGVKDFVVTNSSWLAPQIDYLFGYGEDAHVKFNNFIASNRDQDDNRIFFMGQGLSPFANFEIDFGSYFQHRSMKEVLPYIKEVRLMMKIRYKTFNQNNLSFIPNCAEI